MKKSVSCPRLSRCFGKVLSFDFKGMLSAFFESRRFLMLLAVLTLAGHTFAVDMFSMCLMLTLATFALLFAKSLLPVMAVLIIFIYQISVENAPAMPSFSNYYFTGTRFVLLISLALCFLLSLFYAVIFKLKISCRDIRELPNIKSAALLSAAFILNGAFSDERRWESLGFGVLQIISFFIIGYVFFLGIRRVSRERLLDYFTALCGAVSAVLVLETLHLYIFGEVLSGGEAQKGMVLYGWGIWTTAGMDMSVLIPILFLGALRSKRSGIWLLLAHLTYISALLTLSRNALIFATLSLAVSAVIYIMRAKSARPLLIIYACVGVLLLTLSPVYIGGVMRLFSDFFDRGFSDNGRFALWRYGLESFFDAPFFGKGFFALQTDTFRAENFFPPMLHNTAVQLLASMGLFGISAYVIYRVNMLCNIIKRIDRDSIFLLVSMITLLLMSLFDNFVFHIQPMFLFSAEYAVIWASNRKRGVGLSKEKTTEQSEGARSF